MNSRKPPLRSTAADSLREEGGIYRSENRLVVKLLLNPRSRKLWADSRLHGEVEIKATTLVSLAYQRLEFISELKRRGLYQHQFLRVSPVGSIPGWFHVEAMDAWDPVGVSTRPVVDKATGKAPGTKTVSLREAADYLNVRESYVSQLLADRKLRSVDLPELGGPRLPAVEVVRMRQDMHQKRQSALAEMEALTADARFLELEDARLHANRRWVKKTS